MFAMPARCLAVTLVRSSFSDLVSWSFSGVLASSAAVASAPPSAIAVQSVSTTSIVPFLPLPEESTAVAPFASSNRYQATFPPPVVPAADVWSDCTSAAESARFQIWNSSTVASRDGSGGNWDLPT
jgi:hypothetical protein